MSTQTQKRLSNKAIYGPLTQKTLHSALKRELLTNFGFENMALIADLLIDRFLAIVRECPDETLTLTVDGDTCQIDTSDSHFTLNTSDVQSFPTVPESDGPNGLKITVGTLRSMIQRTLFAAARESSRYAINGVLWAPEGKNLLMVATDGRRLAQMRAPLVSAGAELTVIVPVKTMTGT